MCTVQYGVVQYMRCVRLQLGPAVEGFTAYLWTWLAGLCRWYRLFDCFPCSNVPVLL